MNLDTAHESTESANAPAPTIVWSRADGPNSPDEHIAGAVKRDDRHAMARPRRRVSIVAAFAAAIVVAVAVIAVADLRFATTATFRFNDNVSPEQAAQVFADLHELLSEHFEDSTAAATPPWSTRRQGSEVAFTVAAMMPDRSRSLGSELANRFLATSNTTAARAAESPSPLEATVSADLAAGQARTEDYRSRLEESSAELPSQDTSDVQAQALARWSQLRSRFAEARAALEQAVRGFESLEAQGAPQHATAPLAEQSKAYAEDPVLQQDEQELLVNLVELRNEVLKVAEQAREPLARTLAAAQDLRFELDQATIEHTDAEFAAALDALLRPLDSYQQSLTRFLQQWDGAVETVGARQSPRPTVDLISAHERLEQLARDFGREAGLRLQETADARSQLGLGRPAGSSTYAVAAEMLRKVQTLQAAHRAASFDLAMIEPKENFRIDAALRAAQGLHARCRSRTEAINERLNAAALERARMEYEHGLKTAQAELADARKQYDDVAAELVQSQESLVNAMSTSQEVLVKTSAIQLNDALLKAGEQELQRMERQLNALVSQRRNTIVKEPLQLVSIIGEPFPVGFFDRCRAAAAAGASAFIAMLVGQFWLGRTRERPR